jgi:predicted phage tail protein
MRRVILYGPLAERFGKYHEFAVDTAAEAVSALCANFKGFRAYLCNAHVHNLGFKVFVGPHGITDESDLRNPSRQNDAIRIVPRVYGSGGVTKIIIGAVLIAAGALLSPYSAGASTALIGLGLGLAVQGITQLLTPIPKAPTPRETELKTSYLFSGPENTTAQGRPVPIGFGRVRVGSVVISASISSVEDPGYTGVPSVTEG